MRSTSKNLLNLVYRLIASGIILFIVSEVVLAYVVAFHLIPYEKQLKLSKEVDIVKMGLEATSEAFLFEDLVRSKVLSFTRLSNSYESYLAFKHGILDAVLTDQLTARLLQSENSAVPFAFLFDESYRKPLSERFVLVTRSEKADFFEQTKNLRITFSSHRQSTANIIFREFLNGRTGDLTKWFATVSQTDNDLEALKEVTDDKSDVAAVSEVLYKEYLKKNNSGEDDLRVLWYSSPLERNVILLRKGLRQNQLEQIKAALLKEESPAYSWAFFEESLEELNKWSFTIRGKLFELDESKFKSEAEL